MTEPFYVARAEVTKVAGVHRRATIATARTMDLGVHGPIKEHYRLHDAADLPLPVDYIVAATGG
jgi:hypothetical protein